MNHTYRLVWSDSQAAYVAVPEFASRRGKATGLRAAGVVLASILAFNAHALPAGGQVSAGQGNIAQSGSAMTVKQQSQNLAINWQTFGIGAGEFVTFSQPNASAIALNRVLGADPTQIYGRLTANGQVWLLNPNGVLFGGGAQVNVGGLVASTLNLSDADFLAGKRTFSGSGGNVTNRGNLTSSDGGYVSLLGGKVSNEGVIQATLGTVALGAGSQITLNFAGGQLLGLQVDEGVVDALVQNKQLIRANGGTVLMSAKAAGALLGTVVNNDGVIEARTIDTRTGTIRLLGAGGAVQVSGTLDASAPSGGDGGFIETSSDRVKVIDGAVITTAAPSGRTGQWLIDPQDYTVAASGGDITGSALGTALGSSNVQLQSSSGSAAGAGDVSVNDAVTWSANTTLTLTASNNVNVNASITAIGASAGIAINPNTANGSDAASGGGVFTLGTGAAINLPNISPFSTTSLIIGGAPYIVINGLGSAGSTTGTDLQGMRGNLSGRYALGSNIDASPTGTWNGGAGFAPVGDGGGAFAGTFDGLGHTVNGLTINRPSSDDVGLIARNFGVIRDVGLTNAVVKGHQNVGVLAGYNGGTISGTYSDGAVAAGFAVGGLVGLNQGAITQARSAAAVSGDFNVGGLVGFSTGTVTSASASGSISGSPISGSVGGLVGYMAGGQIDNVYATGSVSGNESVGGLVGGSEGTISRAYATGNISANTNAGGLLGANAGVVRNAYATGSVTGDTVVGGLVALNEAATISSSYSTGVVTGRSQVGGLVGSNAGSITASYWDMTTSGQSTSAGGTGLTTAQALQQSSYSGFDFAGTWRIYDGHTYPLLKSFLIPVTVTANDVYKTYDRIAFAGGNGVVVSIGSATELDGNLVYTGSSQRAINAGTYSIAPSGLWSTAYDIAYVNGSLVIEKAPLIIAAVSDSRPYNGTTESSAAPMVIGIRSGDVVTGASQAFTSRHVLGTNGSTLQVLTGYTVNDGNGGANYTVSASNAAGTITPAALTITTSPVAKTYDGSTSASGTAVVSAGQLFGTDSLSGGSFAYTDKNAGVAKTVTVSGVSVSDGNGGADYVVSYLSNTSSIINKAPLTVTANNAAKTYDALAFSGGNGVTYAGFVAGEAPSVLGGTLTYSGTSQGAANAGSYSIVPSGYTAGNYSIGYFAGTLTVNPKPISVSISGTTTKVYDGNGAATVANSAYVLSGFVGSQSAMVNQPAGNYNSKNVDEANTVTATLGGGNFTAGSGTLLSNYVLPTSASGIGTITPATLTYLANATTMTKGNPVPALSGTVTGFVGADTLTKATTGTLSWFTNADSSSKAGSYFINGRGLTANHGNYVFVQAPSNATALTVVNCTPTKTKTCP